jgi:hypothetical protein
MLRGVDLDPGLVQWIEAQTGATVVDARRTFGGGSRITWFVDVEHAGVGSALVLRQESGAGAFSGSVLSLAREGAVYRALRAPQSALRPARPRRRAGPADRTPCGLADLWRLTDGERTAALATPVDARRVARVEVDRLALEGFAAAARHHASRTRPVDSLAR